MAEKVLLKNEKNDTVEKGYLDFSWTTFFFGFFTPLFRKDYGGFFCILMLEVVFVTFILEFLNALKYKFILNLVFRLKFLTALSLANMELNIFAFIIFRLMLGYWYNKYHIKELIKKGYRPVDEEGEKLLKSHGIYF